MKYLIAVLMLFSTIAHAGGYLNLGASRVANSNIVDNDTGLFLEGGLRTDLLYAGAYWNGSPDTAAAAVKSIDDDERETVTRATGDMQTYGVCGGVHKQMGFLEPTAGVCFSRFDYGFDEEDAFSARAGVSGIVMGLKAGLHVFHDFTDDPQNRVMLTVGVSN